MKKIISILVSIALLVSSVCVVLSVQATEAAADTTVSPETMQTVTGLELSSSKLVYQNDLNTATEPPVPFFSAYVGGSFNGTSVVSDGKWVTGGELGTSSGLGGIVLTDFAYGFQISSPDMVKGDYVHFVYHNATGWGGAYGATYVSMSMSGSNIVFGQAEEGSTAITTYAAGDIINVIITCNNGNLSTYVWKQGEAVPTSPLLTYDGVAEQSGGMYFHTKGNFAFDNFYIYDLNAISPENMQAATGLTLTDRNLIYQNNLNDATEAPVGMFSAYVGGSFNGTSVISDGKWVTGGELGTSTGLSGNKNLTDFAYGFQFTATNTTTNKSWIDFIYHSTTGWGGQNPNNRLNMWINNGKFVFGLYGKENVSQSITTNYVDGDTLNVILTYVDGTVSAYIWKLGETVPTTPTLSVVATIESYGDMFFHPAAATYTMDNFYVYDLSDTTLYPEQIADVTDIAIDEDMLVYSNNFDSATEPPVTYHSAYESLGASSTISDGKWVTGGQLGTKTGLSKFPHLKNFAYGFQFTVDNAASGYFATFAYHTTTGWKDQNPDKRIQMWENGGKLVFDLYANDGDKDSGSITARATTDLVQGDLINVVMTYVDGKVCAYIWKAGLAAPMAPTLSVDATVASEGDFHFTFINAEFALDNFYVYDLTSEDSDGVYTTMESSYRVNKELDKSYKMPKTIEATIKLPTIFTGGTANTIIGNYSVQDWMFSFEINADGNPRVIYNPPWRDWKYITFTDIDVRTGEWEHLALVLENPNSDNPTVTCYLNGDEVVQTVAIPAETVNTQYTPFIDYEIRGNIYIGTDERGDQDKYHFKGKIKNLTMFSDVRTADEIKADMKGVSSSADGLIADYDFDGCYGTGVKDNSANGYDLINVGYMATAPEAPTNYDYSFAVVGDTQILNYQYPGKFSSIYDWLVNNKEEHKIQYVMGLGDITDRDGNADEQGEWARAAAEISKLNGKIPYSVVRGNHDSEAKFSQYLTDIYSSQIDGCYNNDINNSYKIFTVGEVDYLLINLNMGAIDEELAWAEKLISTHQNHNVIITTHIYLDTDGTLIDDSNGNVSGVHCRNDATANNGDDIWNELVSKYSNISLVLSGHMYSSNIVYNQRQGANGNTVTELMIDPQGIDESYSAGPAGMVAMLYFSNNGKDVQVRYYSTVRDEFFGPQNQFSFTLDTVDSTVETNCSNCGATSGENAVTTKEPTYFIKGETNVTCSTCGAFIRIDEVPATNVPLKDYSASFANGKLTIKWTYSDELAIDIAKGAVITFNYAIGEHKGSVQVSGTQSGEVTLEGFNADRLNADLTYSLTAVYGENDTAKLKSATEKTVQAANVSTDTKLNTLLEALKNENTEVSGTMIDTNDFVSNTIEADIKAGTMGICFVASEALIERLSNNKNLARVNKLYVTIDGLETKEFTLEKLTKVTIVNISGLSFEQLYGKVTVKIGFEYAADTTKNFDTNEVVFDAASVIAAANTDAANALEAYMTK